MAFSKKKTEKLWVWRAICGVTRKTIGWVLGDRSKETGQKLIDKIGLEGKEFVTDDYDVYHQIIPEEQLHTGKDLTIPIEQDNSDVRHHLARFTRRTKVVSKCEDRIHEALKLLAYYRDPDNVAKTANDFIQLLR